MLAPVDLSTDPDLSKVFGGTPMLVSDATNQGYVHAPSLNHAVAAAVLRNGYISDASPQNRQTMAVNLTSERVRTAMSMIEGIRAGQSLSSLLGYQFERGLHDRHNLAEVDKFIYKLRKAFPIRADRITSTKTEEGVSIEAIEARNVINGLALVEHMTATQKFTYPFGKDDVLPDASPLESAAIDAEADRLRESHDAVADLALSEGVYQAVLGNYDRVASTYDAYARGNFPPEPDVVRTPLNGISLTHRVALQLESGVSATNSPVPSIAMTPRAQAEPALNSWIAGVLPDPAEVGCVVTFLSVATGAMASEEVTLAQVAIRRCRLGRMSNSSKTSSRSRHSLVSMTARFDLIGIVVSDMARALAFYRRLGFDLPASADAEPHVEATLPGGLRIAWDTDDTIRSFDTGWTPPSGGHRMGLAFAFDDAGDVDATYASLIGAGYEGRLEPFDAFWGQRYATVHDPDGNPVDLFAPLPGGTDGA